MASSPKNTAANESIREKEGEGAGRRASYTYRLEAIENLPRRHWLLHWSALVLSLGSLGAMILGMSAFQKPLPGFWIWFDIAAGAFFVVEFFTRSGFHWNPLKYVNTHIFDFIALVPALMFLHHGIFAEGLWAWLILVCRVLRAGDRVLGDGFILHNFFTLLEGFEEEITDRVVLRIIERVQADMTLSKYGGLAADALEKNKEAILRKVREEHPHDSIGAGLAHLVGLEAAVERAESRIYDAMVDVLRSPEVDEVIKMNLGTIFDGLRAEIGKKDWLKHLGSPRRKRRSLYSG